MRVAWFAPEPNDIARELGQSDVVDHFDEPRAHDFVWQHFRAPYDITVFELGDSARHEFIWPYLFHYPGVVLLRAMSLQQSRTAGLTLHRRHHHLRTERAFSGSSFLRAPLAASRQVVVHDHVVCRELQEKFPTLTVGVAPIGAAPSVVRPSDGRCRFHVVGSRREVVERAAARARDAGIEIEVSGMDGSGRDGSGRDTIRENDVVIALEWPPTGGPPVDAVRAMAAALPAIVLETEAIAAWPMLDPQTWQRRGYGNDTPVAISIDPRDEEHSLMLALRRLAGDASLRASLGAAAGAWARESVSLESAAARWRQLLQQAMQLAPSVRRMELPSHLLDDGSERARSILSEFGQTVDLFAPLP